MLLLRFIIVLLWGRFVCVSCESMFVKIFSVLYLLWVGMVIVRWGCKFVCVCLIYVVGRLVG